jgi:hypothetical protein
MSTTVTVSIGRVKTKRDATSGGGPGGVGAQGVANHVLVSFRADGAALRFPTPQSQGASSPEPASGPGRIPRVAKLMALAIRYQKMLEEGVFEDITQLAAFAQVTQPRMTQIMNLNHLAPDIQERLLLLPPILKGKDTIHEHMLRRVCAVLDWEGQRLMWEKTAG